MMKKINFSIFALALTIFAATNSYASLILGGTKFIYEANKKSSTITVRNPEDHPYLVQSWLTHLDGSTEGINKLFVVTPPLFKINADTTSVLRFVKIGDLPEDKESVFWLNVKSIPPSDESEDNIISFAVNTRIKFYYRPSSLSKKDAMQASKNLTFKYDGEYLNVSNPTPFYVSIVDANVNGYRVENPGIVEPFGIIKWNVPNTAVGINEKVDVKLKVVTDYGSVMDLEY